MAKTTKTDWVHLDVILKETDHKLIPDVVAEINKTLQKMGLKNTTVEWFWGSMPPAATKSLSDINVRSR